jgi:hypothetical protein
VNPTAFVDDARVVCNAIADASKWDDNDGDDIEIIRRPLDDDDDDDDDEGLPTTAIFAFVTALRNKNLAVVIFPALETLGNILLLLYCFEGGGKR